MTIDPNTTTDAPDAPTLDADQGDADQGDAPMDDAPVDDAPMLDDAVDDDAVEPGAPVPLTPVPLTDDVPTEASARDADAAAAAAALFGVDATATPSTADANARLSAAEREYEAAMRAVKALGFDESAPTAAIDREAATAERLAEQLGLGEEKPPAPLEPEAAEDAAARLAAAEADEILGPDAGDGRAWYVLNTYSGHENKVDENLKRRVESMDVADRIFDVVVPTEEELEIRGGQRRQVQRKLLPGYVLVSMILDDDTWYVVRNTPGVTGFVGADKPHALPREEVAGILKQTRVAEPRVRVGFEVADMVRVMEGPFQDFSGEVDEINIEKGKVRVMISMFGRDTPVELDFMQVEKV